MDTLNSVRSLTSRRRTRDEESLRIGAALAAGGVPALFARDGGGSIRRAQGGVEERRGELEREKLGFANANERGGLGRVGR